LIGGAALAGGTALALGKSSDLSGPRQAYFLDIQKALLDANIAQPSLVIDRTRLNANIDQLMSDLPDGMGYRIVSKSLPSLELLAHIRRRSRSDRLMTFNLPMLLAELL
jgi:D-serine deaminase-like pyridoxal phosphate-dependent protein